MTRETTTRQVYELYAENDAATKRSLEGLANSISQFREAVRHIAEEQQNVPAVQALEQASHRRQSVRRRIMLEWSAAAALCMGLLVPGIGYYRSYNTHLREQQQQAQKQREADSALLDQVASEVTEDVPDSMRPLAGTDSDYTSKQISSGEVKKAYETK
jgi:predicted anti-sigma-YlaC factor YlaD